MSSGSGGARWSTTLAGGSWWQDTCSLPSLIVGSQAHEEINAPALCSTAVGRQTPGGRIVQLGRLCILTRIIKAPSKRSMSALSAPEGGREPVEPGGRVGAPATPLALGLLPFAVSSYLRSSSSFCLFHPPKRNSLAVWLDRLEGHMPWKVCKFHLPLTL